MSAELGEVIRAAIDKAVADDQDDGWRTHLGMSIIGRACAREVWYNFRWFKRTRHLGRLLRLWKRGHDEEPRIIEWLRGIGAVISDRDPETGKQRVVSDHGGHYGGSDDGRISNLERFGLDGWGLLECKTHSDKSFKGVKEKGVLSAKPEHYVQMQEYMHYNKLLWALYVAVNKNDDELYLEVVIYRPEMGQMYSDRALQIITADAPPPRINESPAWWVCKMCSFREICHQDETPAKNCRTCTYSAPNLEQGGWVCAKWRSEIPPTHIKSGCDQWEVIPK